MKRDFWRKPTQAELKEKDERDTQLILEKIKSEQAVAWSEDFNTREMNGRHVMFDSDSYNRWVGTLVPKHLQELGVNGTQDLGDMMFQYHKLPLVYSSIWRLGPIVQDCGRTRSMLSLGPRRGACCFDKDVHIPQIVKKHGQKDVWMSLTPMEILTQRPGLRQARGRVLVGGLGMGWFARRCCERKQVKSVTVLEINREVAKHFSFEHPKLKIEIGDVFSEDTAKYDSVLLDVWDDYGDAEGTPALNKIIKSHDNVWAWGNVTSGFTDRLW